MRIVEVTMTADRIVPGYGLLRAGSTYSLDEGTAADLNDGASEELEAEEERTVQTSDQVETIVETQSADPAPENAAARTGRAAGKWPLRISPQKYLDRHPDGPNAALARALLGQS